MLLYHGTNTKRLDSIKKLGLLLDAPKASKGDDYIYLTDKPEIAAEFSGFGVGAMGKHHEGYMTPRESKLNTGVVLTVKIDKKFLEKDKTWEPLIKDLRDKKKLFDKIFKEIKADWEKGDQTVDFFVEKDLYKYWKETQEDMEVEDKEDYEFFIESVDSETLNQVADGAITKLTEKEVDKMLKEAKIFLAGNLYQYSQPIPVKDIVKIESAKKYLSTSEDSKYFGNQLEIEIM